MEEQLITYKTAQLAKEKGFNVPVTYGVYGKKMKLTRDLKGSKINWNAESKQQKHSKATSVPTQSLLQKWLRKEYKTYVYCIPFDNTFEAWLPCLNGKVLNIGAEEYLYEQALELGLQEALKLIKTDEL